jgi:hypothetical protein
MEPNNPAERFARTGAAVVEQIVPLPVATYLASVMSVMHGAGGSTRQNLYTACSVFGDRHSTRCCHFANGWPRSGVDLLPTHSFARTT